MYSLHKLDFSREMFIIPLLLHVGIVVQIIHKKSCFIVVFFSIT